MNAFPSPHLTSPLDLPVDPAVFARFACPVCQGALDCPEMRAFLRCQRCSRRFPLRKQQPDFRLIDSQQLQDSRDHSPEQAPTTEEPSPNQDETERWQNAIKMKLRQHSGLYRFLVYTIGTALYFGTSSQRFVDALGPNAATLSVGAGVLRLKGNVTHLDYEPYPHLEVVGDANHLPFADNTFDGVVCETLLEHVVEPERVIAEMFRVLKPGGKIYILMPFLFAFHAAPNDFHRMTHRGLEYRMRHFEIEKLTPFSGPASALNNILVDFLALLCSFGSRRLYRVLTLVFLVLCSPVKLLDFVLSFHPEALRIASILLCIARKPLNRSPAEI